MPGFLLLGEACSGENYGIFVRQLAHGFSRAEWKRKSERALALVDPPVLLLYRVEIASVKRKSIKIIEGEKMPASCDGPGLLGL